MGPDGRAWARLLGRAGPVHLMRTIWAKMGVISVGIVAIRMCSRLSPILDAFVAVLDFPAHFIFQSPSTTFSTPLWMCLISISFQTFFSPQEPVSKYRPGGFHPVRLGDTFKGGRYTI